jgi:hypothetical protein
MKFDDIILALVGLGCALYLGRKIRSALKGDSGCSGCSSCPSAKSGCCGAKPENQEKPEPKR